MGQAHAYINHTLNKLRQVCKTDESMPSKKTRYTRLETDPESSDSDEAPPTHVHSSQSFKGKPKFDINRQWLYTL